ncbi:hypothetical protein XENORESO_002455 [Xenotaenia resolanae]|uniref:Uncharacterized protein n=1 Tax=Xenotaenia resolanae TaxID=208358 RepID=A0ABV0WI51_9TELE
MSKLGKKQMTYRANSDRKGRFAFPKDNWQETKILDIVIGKMPNLLTSKQPRSPSPHLKPVPVCQFRLKRMNRPIPFGFLSPPSCPYRDIKKTAAYKSCGLKLSEICFAVSTHPSSS